jgi:hypothetical protein
MRRAIVLILALGLLGPACTSARPAGPPRQADVLTSDEIRGALKNNAYEVVAVLRPHWMQRRGQISFQNPEAGQVIVYLNGMRVGGAEYLRQLSVLDVVSMRFISATEAGARFGIQQNGGAAILVNTQPGG